MLEAEHRTNDPTARPLLDDLRGFRHRFRHSYDYPLDAGHIRELAMHWLREGSTVGDALRSFAQRLPVQ